MSIAKKSCNHALLALITLVMIAVSAITFAPSVVKAEDVPEAYESTFEIKGENRSGFPSIYYVDKYSKGFSSIDITLEEYSVDKWVPLDTLTKGMLNKGDKLAFEKVEFDVYYRVCIENGSNVDYSNYVIIKSAGSSGSESGEEPGSGSTPGGGSGTVTDDTENLHCKNNGHSWSDPDPATKARKCSYCGKVCNHEKYKSGHCTVCGLDCDHANNTNTEKKNLVYKDNDDNSHLEEYYIECSVCGAHINKSEAKPHNYEGGKIYEYVSEDSHEKCCKDCDHGLFEKHTYVVEKATYTSDSYDLTAPAKGHNVTYKCSVCGRKKEESREKHTLVNGVCSVCGWKKVTPGKVTGVKIKKSVKLQTRKFGGYWRGLTYIKATYKKYKICKATISFKKAKNAAYYVIEKTPKTDTTVADSWTIKTNKLSKEMWFMGNAKKATFKITPYSKEGVKGKTFKKTIKL